jgi:outer membrane protein assembly factor BamB
MGTLICSTLFVLSAIASDADWPQWRGPNRDGVAPSSPKLLDSWPKDGPPILWKSEWIPAYFEGGCGAPLVVDGKVFVYVCWKQPVGGGNTYKIVTPESLAEGVKAGVLTADQSTKLSKLVGVGHSTFAEWAQELQKTIGGDHIGHHYSASKSLLFLWRKSLTVSDTVICLDAATGKTLWKKDFPTGEASYAKECSTFDLGAFDSLGGCATPAVWKDKIYAVGILGLYCLSAKDGSLLWQVKGRPEHASPMVVDGVVYHVGSGYDAETGKFLWKSPTWAVAGGRYGWGHYQSPYLWSSSGKNYIITTAGTSDGTVCLDPASGKILWTLKGTCEGVSGDILIADNKSFRITPTATEQICKIPGASFGAIGMDLMYEGHVYVCGSMLTCIGLTTGESTWRKTGANISGDAFPILADGKLFLPSDDLRIMRMVKASPDEEFAELGSFSLGLGVWNSPGPSPALANGKLYVRSPSGFVVCYDLEDHAAPKGQSAKADPNAGRQLKYRKCIDRMLVLSGNLRLQQNGGWNQPETYAITGAKITKVTLDPKGKNVTLTTDKAWKTGDTVTLTYSSIPSDPKNGQKATLTFQVPEAQASAAKFVKIDDATHGSWKGVYGKEGAIVAGDAGTSAAPKCAVVEVLKKNDTTPWASQADANALQKTGETQERSIVRWEAFDEFDITIEFTDGKEHQVAIYCCRGPNGMSVTALDSDSKAVLDTQTVKEFHAKYLVWNLKGSVTLRLANVDGREYSGAVASGIFIDPAPAK